MNTGCWCATSLEVGLAGFSSKVHVQQMVLGGDGEMAPLQSLPASPVQALSVKESGHQTPEMVTHQWPRWCSSGGHVAPGPAAPTGQPAIAHHPEKLCVTVLEHGWDRRSQTLTVIQAAPDSEPLKSAESLYVMLLGSRASPQPQNWRIPWDPTDAACPQYVTQL